MTTVYPIVSHTVPDIVYWLPYQVSGTSMRQSHPGQKVDSEESTRSSALLVLGDGLLDVLVLLLQERPQDAELLADLGGLGAADLSG